MLVSDFHFDLPESLIAQRPLAARDSSRMLVLDRLNGRHEDSNFSDLPGYLHAGDLLVLNDSRVIPARLYATRARSTVTQASSPDPAGRIEVLLTERRDANLWTALVRPSRKLTVGERLRFDDPETQECLLEAKIVAAAGYGERTLQFEATTDFMARLERIGHIPLPPYIKRDDVHEDSERYQTVFANQPGSAAAPTAGLHFTPEVLVELQSRGVQTRYITLHVGLGTFQPVRAAAVADIHLHAEHYTLPAETASAINGAMREGRRIIAAGTTTTRTLEHCAARANDAALEPHSGQTSIFISPGHRFRIVQGLLTNFHLPQSTLLMLVSAFAGRERVLAAYSHAVAEQYRFFSYGDCMLIL